MSVDTIRKHTPPPTDNFVAVPPYASAAAPQIQNVDMGDDVTYDGVMQQKVQNLRFDVVVAGPMPQPLPFDYFLQGIGNPVGNYIGELQIVLDFVSGTPEQYKITATVRHKLDTTSPNWNEHTEERWYEVAH